MKNLKKATALFLSATMIMSSSTFALANENTQQYQVIKAYDVEQAHKNSLISNVGVIKELVNKENLTRINIVIKNIDGVDSEVALNISDDTIFVDNEAGIPTSIDKLKVGDKICAYYSEIMTKSIPPQSNASYIITNILEEKSIARPLIVSEITKNEDGSIKVLSNDNMYLITILPNNPISPFKTKQNVTINDIKVGSRILVWFDIMTLSLPAQSASEKTIILPDAIKDTDIEVPNKIQINGNSVELGNKQIYIEADNVMVPLRAVSEALGFSVKWEDETKTIALDNGAVKTTVQIGLDSYYSASSKAIGLTAPFTYGTAPTIKNGDTYVPLKLYNLLNQGEISVSNGTIIINKN